jgi:hypothetical protein
MTILSLLLCTATAFFLHDRDLNNDASGEPTELWSGSLSRSTFDSFPRDQQESRFIVVRDPETLRDLWAATKQTKNELPDIDFDRESVVVDKNVEFLNRLKFVEAKVDGPYVEMTVRETKTTRPIREKVYGIFVRVPSAKVRSVTSR